MNKVNWTAVALFCIVALLAFMVGVSLFGGWRYGGWGMMGTGRMGPGMMGGWGFSPFGWLGMILMWLIPVGLVALAVAGVVWLVRAITGGGTAPGAGSAPAGRTCPRCGRLAQADWHNCPYCGQELT
jgi:hypothetical protein